MRFDPIGLFLEHESLLMGSPLTTYYCLKSEKLQWTDTIYNLPSSNEKYNMFETCFFDREQNLIFQRRYFEDGKILFEAIYDDNSVRRNHRSYLVQGRSFDEWGASTYYGTIQSLTIYNIQGDTVLQRSKKKQWRG